MPNMKATHIQNLNCPWPRSLCGVPYAGRNKKGERHAFPQFADDPTCQSCITSEKAARKRGE